MHGECHLGGMTTMKKDRDDIPVQLTNNLAPRREAPRSTRQGERRDESQGVDELSP
jgi:hypothetical protein